MFRFGGFFVFFLLAYFFFVCLLIGYLFIYSLSIDALDTAGAYSAA
jgi:hypothetical protein